MDKKAENSDDNDSFASLKKTIKEVLGFESEQYSDNFIKRRISIRMRANNISSYDEYKELFKDKKDEQQILLKNLTIHVTEFFRDESFWNFCKEKFFKEALILFSHKKTINIWSAGCSSGQEAVSILISFLEINKDVKDRLNIICTDISNDILDKAKNFEYEDPYETKGLKEEAINKYFTREKEKLTLKEEYTLNFKFIKHDLLKDPLIKDADIVLLRNTVIYFSKAAKENLYLNIYNAMNTPSFFIIGKTETLIGPAREKFGIYESKERIFKKD